MTKFKKGDRVFVVKEKHKSMSPFNSGWGTVRYSYTEMYGGHGDLNDNSYSIDFDKGGPSSWYPAQYLVPKEIWDSPLYNALNEEEEA